MKRLSFLSVFFIVLGLVFVAAAVMRVKTADLELVTTIAGDATSPASQQAATTSPGNALPAETGTIVETTSDGRPLAAASTDAVSTREQRYRELLNSTPPAPSVQTPVPPQPVAEKPTLIQRAMNAIGIGEDKPKRPAAPAPVPPRPQQQASNQTPQQQQPKPNDPRDTGKPVEERDAESDTVPPQLVALEFNPPQVADGETTQLYITAQDDLSGIRTISGVIANPTGATVNGFAAQREGDSNRYTARIVIPKDAAEGNWHIKYLSMADNASNQVNLSYGQNLSPAMASFRVTSSRSDSQGPSLKSLWIDKRSMAAGEKNTVFVQAEDDKAGVQLVSGVFVSPGKVARIGFGCRVGGSGAWECTLNVPECVDCGLWQLEQVQMQDKANNTTTVRLDNDMIKSIQVDVSGNRCDGAAPVLTALQLNPPAVSNAELSYVSVVATVQDDTCGGATLSGLVTGPNGNRLAIVFDPSKDGQHFTGKIEVRPNTPSGTYTVAWIQALDKGQNLRAYSANDPVVGQVTFKVE